MSIDLNFFLFGMLMGIFVTVSLSALAIHFYKTEVKP